MRKEHDFLRRFDTHSLLIAATRYYMGRMTIAGCQFAQSLAAAWQEIPLRTRHIIRRDLEEEFKADDEARRTGKSLYPLGMDMDRAEWEKVRQAWGHAGEREC